MANFQLATGSQKELFSEKYALEYTRISRFLPYTGANPEAVITTGYEVVGRATKNLHVPYFRALHEPAVYNTGLLEGKEEAQDNYNFTIGLDWVRKATSVSLDQEAMTEIDLMNAGRKALRVYAGENLRDWIILNGLGSFHANGQNYTPLPIYDAYGNTVRPVATENEKDAWLTANSDRVLFGNAVGNTVAGDHSASLAAVTSGMKMTAAIGMMAKELATTASDFRITPTRTEDDLGREYYVCFLGQRAFRDLQQDPAMVQANRDARAREASGMNTNPLFQDGDLLHDGIIYRCVPEITSKLTKSSAYATAGSGGISVEPGFLCGAQAVGLIWAQKPSIHTNNTFDYGFIRGVEHRERRGVDKLCFNGVQTGMVSFYTAGVATA